MKKIKLIFLILSMILLFLIYNFFWNDKINYLSLGDGLALGVTPYDTVGYGYSDYIKDYLKKQNNLKNYDKSFASEDYRTTDLINDIKQSKTHIKNGKKENINYLIASANIISISIGRNDLYYKLRVNDQAQDIENNLYIYSYVDEIFNDINELIKEIRKVSNSPIVFIGFYNPINKIDENNIKELTNIFSYIEEKFLKLTKQKKIYYISTYQKFNQNKSFLPNPIDTHPSQDGYEYIYKEFVKIYNKFLI